MNSKVLLLGLIEYMREIYLDGITHGQSADSAFWSAMDAAEEVAKKDNPISAMIFGNINEPGTLAEKKAVIFTENSGHCNQCRHNRVGHSLYGCTECKCKLTWNEVDEQNN